MDAPERKRRGPLIWLAGQFKRRPWPWIFGVIVGVPLLYLGSIGPIYWLDQRGNLSKRTASL
jgi:hypothetical protein